MVFFMRRYRQSESDTVLSMTFTELSYLVFDLQKSEMSNQQSFRCF